MRSVDRVEIVDYRPEFARYFQSLNVEWLEKYYRVEAVDEAILGNPEDKILAPGGAILFARLAGEIVGTVALKYDGDGVYELTKMAVTESAQGQGIGRKLLEACVDRYRSLGGRLLYLESQRRLLPALRLYETAGFRHMPRRHPSQYERSDVYMEFDEGR